MLIRGAKFQLESCRLSLKTPISPASKLVPVAYFIFLCLQGSARNLTMGEGKASLHGVITALLNGLPKSAQRRHRGFAPCRFAACRLAGSRKTEIGHIWTAAQRGRAVRSSKAAWFRCKTSLQQFRRESWFFFYSLFFLACVLILTKRSSFV